MAKMWPGTAHLVLFQPNPKFNVWKRRLPGPFSLYRRHFGAGKAARRGFDEQNATLTGVWIEAPEQEGDSACLCVLNHVARKYSTIRGEPRVWFQTRRVKWSIRAAEALYLS